MDHDLSVPAVSTILLSMIFWAAGRASGVLLAESAQPRVMLHLTSLAAAATVFVEIGVRDLKGVGYRMTVPVTCSDGFSSSISCLEVHIFSVAYLGLSGKFL